MKIIKLFLVLSLFALFASIFIFQKITLKYAEPFFSIGFRMFISGVILVLHTYLYEKKINKIKFEHIKFFVYLTLCNIYLNSIFEIWGLNNMPSSKVCLIYSLSPFVTSIIAFFVLNEILTIKKILGIAIGFIGLIPIIYTKNMTTLNYTNLAYISYSELSIILAVLFSVIGWILLKKIIELGYSFILANGLSMLTGGILLFIHSYVFGENWHFFPVTKWDNFITLTLITALISNIICYNLFGYLLNSFSTTFMTFAGLITPFFASFFGWFFLKETISVLFFISISIFLLGLIIFYKEETK